MNGQKQNKQEPNAAGWVALIGAIVFLCLLALLAFKAVGIL